MVLQEIEIAACGDKFMWETAILELGKASSVDAGRRPATSSVHPRLVKNTSDEFVSETSGCYEALEMLGIC